MKKAISLIMAIIMCLSLCVCAFAADSGEEEAKTLQFGEDGKFTILQDGFPADERMFDFIYLVIEKYQPDLVVLGGDNSVGSGETKAQAIEELVSPYVNTGTYFTMVFGNHDHQQGVEKPELFEMYKTYGGEYFLGVDEDNPESSKVGTHFLPVYSSDGSKIAYGLYMFDSGNYAFNEDGEEVGYDCVDEEQIQWYKDKRDGLKEETGDYVPSIAFQHIVPGEVYDNVYYRSAVNLGELGRSFYGNNYTFVPKLNRFSGFLNEPPCPGYYNYGQIDALAEKGDVQAVFVGHDHVNSYDVVANGVHIINSPAITYNSYSSKLNQGCTLIEIDESTSSYSREVITVNALALEYPDYAEKIGVSAFTAGMYETLGNLLLALGKAFAIFGTILDFLGAK